MKLVFLGPPGAGKGTQAQKMAEEFSVKHASTGDIFRQAVGAGSDLGRTVKSILDSGRLVPDEITSRVVKEMIAERFDSYILDGYPRTVGQAEDLEAMLRERGEALDAVLYYELDEESAVRRLTGRLVCEQCGRNYHRDFMPPKSENVCDECGGPLTVRSDSSEDVVRKRLREYEEKTAPLVPYYRERGLLKVIDAGQDPESVSRHTRAMLNGLGTSA